MIENRDRIEILDVTLDDIADVVRDNSGFNLPVLSGAVALSEFSSSDYLTVGDRNELYHKLQDPDLTPEQKQQIIYLRVIIGKIASSVHFRIEFERDFNRTFQPSLFQEVA